MEDILRHYFIRLAVNWQVAICLLTLLVQPLALAGQSQASSDSRAGQNESNVTGTVPPEPTGKHKLNSRLYIADGTKRNLIDRARKEKSIDMVVEVPMTFFPNAPTLPTSLGTFVRQQVCSSDAVVVGHVTGKQSFLTESQEWIFTDYDVQIDDVFKSTDDQRTQPDSQIVVTRTGGELLIYGRPVKATHSLYQPFLLGDKYILFLKFLPTAESYEAVTEGGAYRIASGKVWKLTRGRLIPELSQPLEWATFENEVRIAAAQPGDCDSGKGGSR